MTTRVAEEVDLNLEHFEQQEVETVLRRFAELSSRGQLVAYALMRDYLDGHVVETKSDQDVLKRKAALEALGKVAAELDLPEGQAPTTTQFTEVARRLGLGWSVGKVVRIWDRWRFAREAYAGHRLRRSAHQQGILDAQGKRRAYEDYVTSIRLFLDSTPSIENTVAYDNWTREFNAVLPHNQPPVCQWAAIYVNLRISFSDILRVAREEVALADCPKTKGTDHRDEYGPLVSNQWIAGEYGLTHHQARHVPRRPDFPKPAVLLSGSRAWLKDDVIAYFAGQPVPQREEFAFQDDYLSFGQLAELMGKRYPKQISQTTKIPEPAGLFSRRRYWLKKDVLKWLEDNPIGPSRRRLRKSASVKKGS
jgi:hypothetical protein